MDIIKSSLACKFFNKLDLKEENLASIIENSIVIKALNSMFSSIQNVFSPIFQDSFIVQNIDKAILIVLSLLIAIIPVSTTGIIGGLIAVAFLALLVKFCTVKGTKIELSSFDFVIFAYMALAALSTAFSSLLFPSIKGYIKMLVYFGGFLTYFNVMKNHPKRMLYIIAIVALTASVEAFYAIYQQIVGVDPLASWQDLSEVNPEQLMDRVYGSLKPYNPNLLAGYLVSTFPFVLGGSFLLLNYKKYLYSIISFICTAAVLLAIVFTGSRGAYMATAAMLSIFTCISGYLIYKDFAQIKWLKKLWLFSILAGVLLVILAVLISPAIQHRIASIFILRGDSSNSYRFNVYASTFKMFLDNWLIGIGPGNTTFRLMYGLYMVTGFDALGAYNIFLEVAAESGIFTLIVFLFLAAMSFTKSIKIILSNDSFERKIIISLCMLSLAGMLIHGFFDTVWYRPQINTIFWILMALFAVGTSNKYYKEK